MIQVCFAEKITLEYVEFNEKGPVPAIKNITYDDWTVFWKQNKLLTKLKVDNKLSVFFVVVYNNNRLHFYHDSQEQVIVKYTKGLLKGDYYLTQLEYETCQNFIKGEADKVLR